MAIFESPEFGDRNNIFTRFGWPVEFLVRAIKDIGWSGFILADALTPLSNMGQNLFDPPDVAGWDLGARGSRLAPMLARMNFASQLAGNQKFNLAAAARTSSSSPEVLLAFVLDALKTPALDATVTDSLLSHLRATGAWTGGTAQLQAKVPDSFISSPEHRLPVRMKLTRRRFSRAASPPSRSPYAAPQVLTDLAAQGSTSRNLVILYHGRRQRLSACWCPTTTRSITRGVRNIGAGRHGAGSAPTRRASLARPHPRLTGLKQVFDRGQLALIQRTGYPNQSRSHFLGTDIWSTADPDESGQQRLGRYLDSLPSPVDALIGWNTTRDSAACAAV